MSKKLLIVTTGLAIGGAEMQVRDLALEFVRRGWEIQIASLLEPVAFVEELESVGIKIWNLKMVRKIPDPRAIFRLARIYREFKPDVVHGHMIHANILSRVAKVLCNVPVLVSTVHSSNEGGRARMMMYRLTDRLCDFTSCICTPAYERMMSFRASRPSATKIIYNAILTDQYFADDELRESTRGELAVGDRFMWLALGRLAAVKDYGTLIRAFAIHKKGFPDSTLYFAGDGDERAKLESIAKDVGCEQSITFLGMRKDTLALYNAADAVAMTSLFEGLSISLLEASSVGVPIMATAVGGNPEVVGPDYPSELQPQPQDIEGIAKAMNSLRSRSQDAIDALGASLAKRCRENFELRSISDQWESVYAELSSS